MLVQHCAQSPAHYWHLRLLCAIALGPLLGLLYLLIFGRRVRPQLRPPAGPTMWITSEGRLLYRP